MRGVVFVLVLIGKIVCGSSGVSSATRHSEFTGYPAFAKRQTPVEVYHDKGLVVEMIVNCGGGRFGIITLSKVEGVFCGPDHRCVRNLNQAIGRLCQ